MFKLLDTSNMECAKLGNNKSTKCHKFLVCSIHHVRTIIHFLSQYTLTTTWTDPRSLTSVPLGKFQWNQLPPGWERFLDPQGDMYYVKLVYRPFSYIVILISMQSRHSDHSLGLPSRGTAAEAAGGIECLHSGREKQAKGVTSTSTN